MVNCTIGPKKEPFSKKGPENEINENNLDMRMNLIHHQKITFFLKNTIQPQQRIFVEEVSVI